jgi:hypothetical protein
MRITESAEDDGRRDGQADERVGDEAHQTVAVQGESGVVERRHGVKGTMPRGVADRVPVAQQKAQEQHHEQCRLDHQGDAHDPSNHAADVIQSQHLGFGRCVHPRPHRDPASQKQPDQGREDHDAQPTQLDEPQDDHLPERRPEGRRVDDDETCHADGAGRSEQRFDEGCAAGSGLRDRGQQQYRSDRDGEGEPESDGLCRMQA